MDKKKTKQKLNAIQLDVRSIEMAANLKGNNVKILLQAIHSLRFTNNTEIQFTINGIKYLAEESQFFQGVAYFPPEFFTKYHYLAQNQPMHSFGIDFSSFPEFCSAIIDNDSAFMKIICYDQKLQSIAFMIEQFDKVQEDADNSNNSTVAPMKPIVTEYIIRTKHSINPINFQAIQSKTLSKILLLAEHFLEIIQNLDRMTEELQITISKTGINFKTVGNICQTKIPFSSDHKFFVKYECSEASKYRYKFTCFRTISKCLALSSEICFETRENGLLKVMLVGKGVEETERVYFEFNIMPDVIDDDNESEELDF